MRLENDFLCVEIAEAGAEVTRIYDKTTDTEVLWEADGTYWKRHSPVLFPNVGKTYLNTMLINGENYPTSQHGFARDSVFTCEEVSTDSVTWCLKASEATKSRYPFDFELYISYRLNGKELDVTWEVKNPSDETIYFTIGGHPAFRTAKKEEKKTDYMLKFPGKEVLEYILLDPKTGTGIVDKTYELKLENELCPVTEEMFFDDAMIFDNTQIEEVWLCHKDGTPYVGIKCKDFPNYGIWSVKDAPFVCLEPWAGRCDNVGFDKELAEKTGVNKAEPGKSFVKTYTICVA
ncbi:MAG: aldose 1-epimerase family protein [Schaedlerella sp.]|nr:aldose 1-epimerase family protein [Schaedlerella sp.]